VLIDPEWVITAAHCIHKWVQFSSVPRKSSLPDHGIANASYFALNEFLFHTSRPLKNIYLMLRILKWIFAAANCSIYPSVLCGRR
jgi:hypothetical protein